MEFSKRDLKQLADKGIVKNSVEKQIRNFTNGFPFLDLVDSARPGNGILQFSDDEIEHFIKDFDKKSLSHELLKFVPASGAATRMFKKLFEFTASYKNTPEDHKKIESDRSFNSIHNFLKKLKDFAFYNDLKEKLAEKDLDLDSLYENKEYNTIIDHILENFGLNYGKLPKGLLQFHKYPEYSRLAIEEHLVEGAFYSRMADNSVNIHFTVSPEHLEFFRKDVDELKGKYEEEFGVHHSVSYSVQKPSTDTLAVDLENNPFRNDDDSMFFRPGGHGALIENLNDLKGDIIFIKNIDNIVPDRLKKDTYTYKKLIGGILLNLQEKVFHHLEMIDKGQFNENDISDIRKFMEDELFIGFPDDFNDLELEQQFQWIENKLNRPIRVCGMVKNEGEPGGGPFWAYNDNREKTLQIVESSQVNKDDKEQVDILNSATHFNPVDLVCAVKDYKGKAFKLKNFVDPNTGFISIKSKNGKDLKALELPGLWNGAMADWNTIFVEVPIVTFNPVKTINDLLRPQHQ